MTATYDHARPDCLNALVGKGNWMKTKRMLDTYGRQFWEEAKANRYRKHYRDER